MKRYLYLFISLILCCTALMQSCDKSPDEAKVEILTKQFKKLMYETDTIIGRREGETKDVLKFIKEDTEINQKLEEMDGILQNINNIINSTELPPDKVENAKHTYNDLKNMYNGYREIQTYYDRYDDMNYIEKATCVGIIATKRSIVNRKMGNVYEK